MLIRAGGGIFLPSDLYQVQDHSWVICLIEAFLLESSDYSRNDRSLLKQLGLESASLLSFAGYSGTFIRCNPCTRVLSKISKTEDKEKQLKTHQISDKYKLFGKYFAETIFFLLTVRDMTKNMSFYLVKD